MKAGHTDAVASYDEALIALNHMAPKIFSPICVNMCVYVCMS